MPTNVQLSPSQVITDTVGAASFAVLPVDFSETSWPLQAAPSYMNILNTSTVDSMYICSTILDSGDLTEETSDVAIMIAPETSLKYGPFRVSYAPQLGVYSDAGGDPEAFVNFDQVVSCSPRCPELVLCWSLKNEIESVDQYIDPRLNCKENEPGWDPVYLPSEYQKAPLMLHIRCLEADLYIVPAGDTSSSASGIRVTPNSYATLGPYLVDNLPTFFASGDQISARFYFAVSAVRA